MTIGHFYPTRINGHIPNMEYDASVDANGLVSVDFGVYATLDVDGILAVKDATVAGSAQYTEGEFAVAYNPDVMGIYGRSVTVVASAANATVFTVRGFDYLGQPMTENFTINGATPVLGLKAFAHVSEVVWLASPTTLNVGWGSKFGLPYAMVSKSAEYVDGLVTGNVGTFAPCVRTNPQTAITGDPRGTFLPHTSDAANGVRRHKLVGAVYEGDLHGIPHFRG